MDTKLSKFKPGDWAIVVIAIVVVIILYIAFPERVGDFLRDIAKVIVAIKGS